MEKIQSTLRIEPGTAASISEHPTSTHPRPESFGLITYLKQQPISIALLSLPHHIISSPGWQCGQLRKILPNSVLPLRLSKSFGAVTSLWTLLARTAMRPSFSKCLFFTVILIWVYFSVVSLLIETHFSGFLRSPNFSVIWTCAASTVSFSLTSQRKEREQWGPKTSLWTRLGR